MDWRRLFNYSRTIFWIGLVLVGYIFVILVNENSKNYRLRQTATELEAENTKLEAQIAQLQNKVTYYASDDYKELAAREKLGLQAPGESVVIVPKKPGQDFSNSTATTTSSTSPHAPTSNFAQWVDFLFRS